MYFKFAEILVKIVHTVKKCNIYLIHTHLNRYILYIDIHIYIYILYIDIHIYIYYIYIYIIYGYIYIILLLAMLRTSFIYLHFSVRYGKKCFFSIVVKRLDCVVRLKFIFLFIYVVS